MHHARKIYKTQPKKQRRQMTSPNLIPSLRMKTLRNKKSFDAEYARQLPEVSYEQGDAPIGGPVE